MVINGVNMRGQWIKKLYGLKKFREFQQTAITSMFVVSETVNK